MHYIGTAIMIGLAAIGLPIMGSLDVPDRTIALPIFISIGILGFAMQIAGLLTERAKMLAFDTRFHSEINQLIDSLGSLKPVRCSGSSGATKNVSN